MSNARYILSLVIVLVLFLSVPEHTLAKDSITWASPRYDPYVILDGPDKGTGISDEIVKLFQVNLSDYDHEQSTANVLRITEELKSGRKFCVPQFIKTPEREAFVYFSSVPSTISPAPGIVLKNSLLKKLGNDKKMSLAKLLDNERLVLGVIKGRSYGKKIDNLLKKYEGQKNIHARVAGDIYQGLLKMLLADRFDYIIGTPIETHYLSRKYNTIDEIAFVQIIEGDDYFMGYTACPKTPWGLEVIKKIDKILLKERPTEKYRSFFERWIPNETIGEYRRAYNKMFLGINQ